PQARDNRARRRRLRAHRSQHQRPHDQRRAGEQVAVAGARRRAEDRPRGIPLLRGRREGARAGAARASGASARRGRPLRPRLARWHAADRHDRHRSRGRDHLGLQASAAAARRTARPTPPPPPPPPPPAPPPAAPPASPPPATRPAAAQPSAASDAPTAPAALRKPLAMLEVINEGSMKGTKFEIHTPLTNIGRGPHNDVALQDESVSASHANILKR